MKIKKSISRTLLRNMIIIAFIPLIAAGHFIISQTVKDFHVEAVKIRQNYINNCKTMLKLEVNNVIHLIESERSFIDKYSLNNKIIESDFKLELLEEIGKIRFEKNGYIFVVSYNGVTLMNDTQRHLIGKNIWELTDPNGIKVIQEERKAAEKPDGDFIYYTWNKPSESIPSAKISFVKGIPDWQWMIGAGFYVDEIDKVIVDKKMQLQKRVINHIYIIALIFAILIILIIIIAFHFSFKVRKSFELFTSFFEKSEKKSLPIEIDKLNFPEFKTLASSANKMIESRMQSEKVILHNSNELKKQYIRSENQRIATLSLLSDINETAEKLRSEINERKLAEEALKESEEQFKFLSDGTFEGILVHKNGIVIDANEAFLKMIKLTRKEAINQNVLDYIPKAKDKAKIAKNIIKPVAKPYTVTANRKDGSTFLAELESKNVTRKGKTVRIVAIHDITERKKAEEEISKLSVAVQQSPSVIAITNLKGNLEYVNPKFTELTGYTQKEVLGLNPKILRSDEQPEETYKELWETITSGKEWRGEFHNKKKNGELFWEAASISPIYNKQGKKINYVKVAEDITQRKLTEKQIERDLVEKSVLLQEIYHRTKNNMQVIASMLRIQSRHTDDEFIHTAFKEIENKIRAMSLVHQKLYQAKDLSRINLNDYTQDLFFMLARSYISDVKNVSFEHKLEDVFILIDSAIPLGLILNELISNVFKHAFIGQAEGKLFIRIYQGKDDTINIHLEDNGIGFPVDYDPRNTETMGLHTMFMLVEKQLNGNISYISENGLKWHLKFKDNQHKVRV